MSSWVPRPDHLLGAALALGAMWVAAPASALPLVDLGANASAAVHFAGGTPALDVNAEANFFGTGLTAQYWNQFASSPVTYFQGTVRKNISPVPMFSVAPGIGAASLDGKFGPLGTLTASFSPLLLPFSIEASAGAAFVGGTSLYPYYAGAKFSPLPFTSLVARYRGFSGTLLNVAGPEVGIEIGI